MNKLLIAILSLLIFACKGNKQNQKENLSFWKSIIAKDMDSLQKQKIKVDHNTQIGNMVENNWIEKPNWENLLKPFLDVEEGKNDSFILNSDSAGNLKVNNYTNLDTNATIQSITIMKSNGMVNVIEVATKENTSLNQRNCTYSYQPQKAFGMDITEKYLWTKPKRIQINAEFIRKNE